MTRMVISLSPPGVRCQVGELVMLIDPASDRKANLILKTSAKDTGFPLPPEVVTGPGEYEIKGVRVHGVDVNGRTIYTVWLEGIQLLYLGELGEEISMKELDGLGAVHILLLSLGGKTQASKEITKLIKQVDPKLIIPTDEKTAKTLALELGQKAKAEEKLVIKRKDLDKEEVANKLVWLKS